MRKGDFMYRTSKNTTNVSRGGLFTALSVIFIYISTLLPINKLYFLAIASCIIPISIIKTSVKNTVVVYLATSIISLLICGPKASVILYGIFFGVYGIIKYYIEKLRNFITEVILKLLFFNIVLSVLLYLYKLMFMGTFKISISIYIFISGAEVVFLIYDYILTIFISRIGNIK
jgi:hypothetical protein